MSFTFEATGPLAEQPGKLGTGQRWVFRSRFFFHAGELILRLLRLSSPEIRETPKQVLRRILRVSSGGRGC